MVEVTSHTVGDNVIGKVKIDQAIPGTTNLVNVNGGPSQTADIKVTLDSETIAVTGPLTDAQLSAQSLAKDSSLTNILNKIIAEPSTAAKQDLIITALGLITTEATAGDIKTAVEALAAATPDTAAGDLARMRADLGTIQADLATVKADIILIKSDVAKLPQKDQLHANINFSDASAQTIIAAPGANNRIRLTRLSLSSGGTPQVNVEIEMRSGASPIETVKGAAMVFDYPEHRNLGTNEAFVLQCTTADRVIGGVDYYIEAV